MTSAEQCLNVGTDNGLPNFQDYGNNGPVTRILRYHQAIIPSYEFTCCGNVTEWGVDVQGRNGSNRANEVFILNLQVWRPSPTTVITTSGTGHYVLVGNNRFTSFTFTDRVARVTPSPKEQAQFRSGDVLGFYLESGTPDRIGLNVLTISSYTSETVWYASIASLNSIGCPISVGSRGMLNTLLQGAPVVSIETGK